jgi:hypothetical protein
MARARQMGAMGRRLGRLWHIEIILRQCDHKIGIVAHAQSLNRAPCSNAPSRVIAERREIFIRDCCLEYCVHDSFLSRPCRKGNFLSCSFEAAGPVAEIDDIDGIARSHRWISSLECVSAARPHWCCRAAGIC